MKEFCNLFLCFTVYSFIGWICETVYCSILFKKLVNRGFLNGPFCPVYGFGSIILLLILRPVPRNPLFIFIVGMVITTLIEYLTALLLEKLFHAKWWDYSANRFNYQGRICLFNSFLFGILSVALIFIVEPAASYFIGSLPTTFKNVLFVFFSVYYFADLAITVRSMYKLNLRLNALSNAISVIKEKLDATGFYNALNIKERLEKVHELLETDRGRAIYKSIENVRARIKQIENDNKAFQKRIIKAFPGIRSTRYPEILNGIKEKVLKSKINSNDDSEENNPGSNKID